MKITVERLNEDVLFKVRNAQQVETYTDGAESVGGLNKGLRPMEMLLASLASCSAIDVVLILKKQRQVIEAFTMEVCGTREDVGKTTPFSAIDIAFKFKGEIDLKKAKRAAALALDNYCSVRASLNPNITITHNVTIESNS